VVRNGQVGGGGGGEVRRDGTGVSGSTES